MFDSECGKLLELYQIDGVSTLVNNALNPDVLSTGESVLTYLNMNAVIWSVSSRLKAAQMT